MNEMSIILTNCDLISITNDKTGEVKTYNRITYLLSKEETGKSYGYAQMQSFINPESFDTLKKYLLKPVNTQYTQLVDKNRFKIKFKKIADCVLR